MKRTSPRNVAASVHARLKNLSITTGRPFNELLQHYGIERFIDRLARSEFVENFILKGALLLRVYDASIERPTRDVDLLGRLEGTPETIAEAILHCLQIQVEDGIVFDSTSLAVGPIRKEDEYGGTRITFGGRLGNARLVIQVDVGIGDVVYPEPVWVEYPPLLDAEPSRIRAYTLESVIAEKYHALCILGLANSRMKDFFDLHYLTVTQSFSGEKILNAIRATFKRRRTSLPDLIPDALTAEFWNRDEKKIQWRAFIRKNLFEEIGLDEVCHTLLRFFDGIQKAMKNDETFTMSWPPGGPWQSVE